MIGQLSQRLFSRRETSHQKILLVSSADIACSGVVAANMATFAHDLGGKVLLVDSNSSHAGIWNLDLPPRIAEPQPLDTDVHHLDMFSRAQSVDYVSTLIGTSFAATSSDLIDQFERLSNDYELTLIDGGYLTGQDNFLKLANVADQIIYIAQQDRAESDEIESALEVLDDGLTNKVSVIWISADQPASDNSLNAQDLPLRPLSLGTFTNLEVAE